MKRAFIPAAWLAVASPAWAITIQLPFPETRVGAEAYVRGTCDPGEVVLTGNGVPASAPRTSCVDGLYEATTPLNPGLGVKEIIASQIDASGAVKSTTVEVVADPSVAEPSTGNPGLAWMMPADSTPRPPATKTVANVAELTAAVASLVPGDIVQLANGTWTGFTVQINAKGTPDKKIVIRGGPGVNLTGTSRFHVYGEHVVIREMNWNLGGLQNIILAGRWNRFTRNKFVDTGSKTSTQNELTIIPVGSQYNEVDHNEFVNCYSMCLKVRAGLNTDPLGLTLHNYVHHNLFRDIVAISSNGQEPIQIAGPNGGGTNYLMKTRVEHNKFYRAKGDPEGISNKAPGNIYRWNVVQDSNPLTIRGGHSNWIEGNIHIDISKWVRIIDDNNTIINNVFKNATVQLGHGGYGYGSSDRNFFYHNTFYGRSRGIAIQGFTAPIDPAKCATGNVFAGNLFAGSLPIDIVDSVECPKATVIGNSTFRRNLFPAAPVDYPNAAGEEDIVADPKLTAGTDGLPVLAADSPAIDAGLELGVLRDTHGRYRVNQPDIGATETNGTTDLPEVAEPPPPEPDRQPWGDVVAAIPGRVEAENFDMDGEGIAYHDNEPQNLSGAYRTAEGVDLQSSWDGTLKVVNISYIKAGEWTEYSVNVANDGAYDVRLRVATPNTGRQLKVSFGGVESAAVTVPNTGGFSKWQTVTVPRVALKAGRQILRVSYLHDGFNLNWIEAVAAP